MKAPVFTVEDILNKHQNSNLNICSLALDYDDDTFAIFVVAPNGAVVEYYDAWEMDDETLMYAEDIAFIDEMFEDAIDYFHEVHSRTTVQQLN